MHICFEYDMIGPKKYKTKNSEKYAKPIDKNFHRTTAWASKSGYIAK